MNPLTWKPITCGPITTPSTNSTTTTGITIPRELATATNVAAVAAAMMIARNAAGRTTNRPPDAAVITICSAHPDAPFRHRMPHRRALPMRRATALVWRPCSGRYSARAVTTPESPRERLLAAAIEHLAQDGSHDLSLRSIASAIGTSHRMLSYHFGSRNGLLTAIVSELERRQRVFMASILEDRDATPGELMWRMWEQVADERLWPYERLFFEMSGRALQGDPDARGTALRTRRPVA